MMKKPQQPNNNPRFVQEIQAVSDLVGNGKYEEALKKIDECEEKYPNDGNFQFNKVGLLIDTGSGLKNADVVKRGLVIGEKHLQNGQYNKYRATTLYNLANGYLCLFGLSEKDSGVEAIPQSLNLQKAKTYFRQMLRLNNLNNDELRK